MKASMMLEFADLLDFLWDTDFDILFLRSSSARWALITHEISAAYSATDYLIKLIDYLSNSDYLSYSGVECCIRTVLITLNN